MAVCETGGDPRFDNGEGNEGIVAWAHGTWLRERQALLHRMHGLPLYAYNATTWQQVTVASYSVHVTHRYFGCLHGASHAWVRGNDYP